MNKIMNKSLIIVIFLCSISFICMPITQSLQKQPSSHTIEAPLSTFHPLQKPVGQLLQHTIDQVISYISTLPFIDIIQEQLQSSPLWQYLSALLQNHQDVTWFLKQHHISRNKFCSPRHKRVPRNKDDGFLFRKCTA